MHRDSVITACDISQSLRLKSLGTRTQQRLGETEESEGEENAWPACQVAIFGRTRPPSTVRRASLSSPNTHTHAHTQTHVHTLSHYNMLLLEQTHTHVSLHARQHTWVTAAVQTHLAVTWQWTDPPLTTHTHTHAEHSAEGKERMCCVCAHSNSFQTHTYTHHHRRL